MDNYFDFVDCKDYMNSMDCKEFINYMDSEDFENFKSNICHTLKSMGDLPFLVAVLEKDVIRYCYDNNILLECYYLLGMVDYLCRINSLPFDSGYDDIRRYKLDEPVFPEGVDFLCYLYENNSPREEFIKTAIPEFLLYNIVESNVRNVA
jgi:hypothetical protein